MRPPDDRRLRARHVSRIASHTVTDMDGGGQGGRTPATDDAIVVWCVAGSLGTASLNRRLLRAIAALAPADVEVRICELLPQVPMFDEELSGSAPAAVTKLRAEIASADALLIATADLNHGIPGVLKNALDWLSVPESRPAVRGRPVVLVGAFPGDVATARCHADLRAIFTSLEARVLPPPWLLLGQAEDRIDDNDQLDDADLVTQVEQLFRRLRSSARRPRARCDRREGAGERTANDPALSSVRPQDGIEAIRADARSRQRSEVLAFLQANLHRASLDLSQIARGRRMSTRSLQRLFTSSEPVLPPFGGGTPRGVMPGGVMNVLRVLRVEHAAGLLRAEPARPIRWVLRESGFSSPSTFHRAFREFTGLTPSEYRQQWATSEAADLEDS